MDAAWRRRFRTPRTTLPRWARDRPQSALVRSNESGRWELYAWNADGGGKRRLTDRPEGTLVGKLDPDADHLWWFDDDHGNEFGRWVRRPLRSGRDEQPEPVRLEPGYELGLELGRTIALAAISRAGGVTIHLIREGASAASVYHHPSFAAVGSLSRDETLFAYSFGDEIRPSLGIMTTDGDLVREASEAPERGLWPGTWSPVPGDQRLLFLHERTGFRRPAILAATGAERELDLPLEGDLDADWFPDARRLLVSQDHRGRVRLHAYDLATGGLEALPPREGSVVDAAARPDGEVWAEWSSSGEPPQVVRVSQGHSSALIPPPQDAPGGAACVDVDAGDVHAFLARPGGLAPWPTIFLVHGGPTSHDADSFSPRVQAWVDHGFAVVLVNYRGSTGYGRAWRDALLANPGFTELEDIAAVRRRLVEAGIADPGRLVLSGRSWGGYLTLLGLGTQPELWSLGIADVPVADYLQAFEDESEPLKAYDISIFGGSPSQVPERYRARSPIEYIDRVRAPVLITGGVNDPRCPIRQIETYVSRLSELGAPHEFYRYRAGHASMVVEELIRQEELKLAFASRYLGTAAPA